MMNGHCAGNMHVGTPRAGTCPSLSQGSHSAYKLHVAQLFMLAAAYTCSLRQLCAAHFLGQQVQSGPHPQLSPHSQLSLHLGQVALAFLVQQVQASPQLQLSPQLQASLHTGHTILGWREER